MTTEQPSFLTQDHLAQELATARRSVLTLLELVQGFTTFEHDQPWLRLDDLLADLRAAAITVAVLEETMGRLR